MLTFFAELIAKSLNFNLALNIIMVRHVYYTVEALKVAANFAGWANLPVSTVGSIYSILCTVAFYTSYGYF